MAERNGGGSFYETQPIHGKRVVVTGGSTGIGRATARLLARHGARVLLFARHQPDLDEAVEEIRGEGGDAHGIAADAASTDDLRRVFREADRTLGGVDVLVNNAALSGPEFGEAEMDDVEYVVRTNVVGYIACAQEAHARMKDGGGGHIVNVGSMSADLREEGGSTYVATKGAIQAFSESLRKTVADDGVRVTLIEPGRVATDMVDASDAEKERKEAEGKMLRPEDVAACIYFALTQPPRCDIVALQVRPHLQAI